LRASADAAIASAAPKPAANPTPQDQRQVAADKGAPQPDAAAAAAKPETKTETQAANTNNDRDTLENALARHFSADGAQAANNAQIAAPDAARGAQQGMTPPGVAVQTSASPAMNQPVPLQGAALAIEIASRAKDGSRQFEIRLDPPELGRIDVKLDVDKNGQVSTHLTVDRPETLDLLRRDSQGLDRALQQAGLKTSDSGIEFSLRQQTADGSFQRNPGQGQPQPQAGGASAGEAEQGVVIQAEQYQWAARMRGGVDIRI